MNTDNASLHPGPSEVAARARGQPRWQATYGEWPSQSAELPGGNPPRRSGVVGLGTASIASSLATCRCPSSEKPRRYPRDYPRLATSPDRLSKPMISNAHAITRLRPAAMCVSFTTNSCHPCPPVAPA